MRSGRRLALALVVLCSASLMWSQTASLKSVEMNSPGRASETDKQIQALQNHVKQAPNDYAGI